MKKSQLIELLQDIEGEPEICVNNEFGKRTYIENVYVVADGHVILEP